MNALFTPYQLTPKLELKNRIIMAPLTRNLATPKTHTATLEMANYYAKRAEAGLIISEATVIREDGFSFDRVPAIYNAEHVKAWRQVTQKVHDNGGKMFSQIWHVGRVSHPHFLHGNLPIAPSKTQMSQRVSRSEGLYHGESRAATLAEVKQLVQSYVHAAECAIEAGFDGVEIHGANGYLIDQFLHHCTNLRQDEYGQTPENMARFALEVVDAVGTAIGYEHVGIRLSPAGYMNEITGEQRDADNFLYLLNALNQRPIVYVHTGNFDDRVQFPELGNQTMTAFLRQHYQGSLIAAGCYTLDTAEQHIQDHAFDLIAFGRPFIANPDFVRKSQEGKALIPYHIDMLQTLV